MKVINIHGYHGNPENSAYTALNELKAEIISPYLDYDSETPDNILENLCKLIKEKNPDIIVGTSLGGFFATILSVSRSILFSSFTSIHSASTFSEAVSSV